MYPFDRLANFPLSQVELPNFTLSSLCLADWDDSWTGLTIDCKKTGSCAEIGLASNQSCTTTASSSDQTFSAAAQADLPSMFGKNSNLQLHYQPSCGTGKDTQICILTSRSECVYRQPRLSSMKATDRVGKLQYLHLDRPRMPRSMECRQEPASQRLRPSILQHPTIW